jgi:hypothetical protein
MRKGFLSSLTAALAGAGLAMAQSPAAPPTALPDKPALVAPQQLTLAPAPEAEPSKDAQPDAKKPKAEAMPAPKTSAHKEPTFEEQMPMPQGRFYGGAEYLLWSTKGERLPPLVTTGPAQPLPPTPPFPTSPAPGSLAPPGTITPNGTQILFGLSAALDTERSGARFTAGYWLDSCQTAAIEASAFWLEPRNAGFVASSNNGTILARPFLNSSISSNPLLAETALVLGSPTQTGAVAVALNNEVWGAEVNTRWYVRGASWYRADVLVGLRYLQVKDSLTIADTSTAQAGTVVAVPGQGNLVASSFSNLDDFLTRNDFYGAQIGTHVEMKCSQWFLDITAKLAMGVMHQRVNVNGFTTALNTIGPGGSPGLSTFPGGLFAQPGQNIGSHTRNEFGIVPELGLVAGYQIGNHAKVFVGYDVIYFRTDIIRPGTQIDRFVHFPGSTAPVPAFGLKDQDFWAAGLTAGVELTF